MEHMVELVFVAAIAVIVLLNILWRRWCARMNTRLPMETAPAKVIDRQMVKYRRGRGLYGCTVVEYYLTFCPEEGMRKEFQVGEAEYDAYHLGDQGPLTWQGKAFISFRPERRENVHPDVPVAFNEEEPE